MAEDEIWFELIYGPNAHDDCGVSQSFNDLETVNARINELAKATPYKITKHTYTLIEEGKAHESSL
jgi:hypothetical protein